jgi:dihydrofolate reductase
MRKLVVCNIMSLDGCYEGPNKNVMNLFAYREDYPEDESFDLYNAERLRAADMLLLGAVSFKAFKGYWPSKQNDPNVTPIIRELSRLSSAINKVVISDTLTADQTAPWTNTRIVKRADAHQAIAELKLEDGKEILIFGSRILWNGLLANGLVDELHIMIGPNIVGGGTLMFDPNRKPPVSLRLINTHSWDGSGIVLNKYEVRPKA